MKPQVTDGEQYHKWLRGDFGEGNGIYSKCEKCGTVLGGDCPQPSIGCKEETKEQPKETLEGEKIWADDTWESKYKLLSVQKLKTDLNDDQKIMDFISDTLQSQKTEIEQLERKKALSEWCDDRQEWKRKTLDECTYMHDFGYDGGKIVGEQEFKQKITEWVEEYVKNVKKFHGCVEKNDLIQYLNK